MRTTTVLLAIAALIAASAFSAASDVNELDALYAGRRWPELYKAVESRKHEAFFRGVVAAVFGDDAAAERLLRSVIASAPNSEQAYDAYEWLTHIYFRNGRYRTLMANMEARWAAFPNKPELKKEQTALAGFRDLPDQTIGKPRFSELRHDPKEIFIPMRIQNVPATYFFDTGAWLNCMSVSEARRLGLAIRESHSTLGTATGERIGFRTAVAQEVTIGAMHFRDVSFAVFNDDEEPWVDLAQGRRGLIRMPTFWPFRPCGGAKTARSRSVQREATGSTRCQSVF